MKKMIKLRMVNIFTVLMFQIVLITAFAADKWSETPNQNDENEIVSVTTRSATLNNRSPDIDLWAETPDLNSGKQTLSVKIVKARIKHNFNMKMYDETPYLR
jgi:hypothetical protein